MKITNKSMLYKFANDYKKVKDKYTIDEYLDSYYSEIVLGYNLNFDKFKKNLIKLLKRESDK